MLDDKKRAAIIALIQSTFPMLILLNVIHISDVQVASIMLFINNGLTAIMLLWKNGQQPSTVTVVTDDATIVQNNPQAGGTTP